MTKLLLVIDGNEPDREATAGILSASGFEVLTASSFDEGLKLAQQQPPAIILHSMMFDRRRMDGWKFLEQRKKGLMQDIPVLVVTGLVVASVEWAFDLGADGLVRKPIDPAELVRKVRDLISRG